MKITNFGTEGMPQPLSAWSTGVVATASNSLFSSTASNTLAVNGVTVTGAAASNYHILASSPTAAAWVPDAGGGGTVSAGSNSTRVREVPTAGASTTLWSPYDHAHDGIGTITASSSNTMQRGTWNLRPGVGIALSLTDTDGDGEFDTATIVNTISASGGGGGGGGSDLVQVASGAGSIIIPGLAGSADIVPASPNGSDDEFDTTDTSDPMTGWTTLQTPTVHDINSTVKSHYYVKKTATAASTGHVGIYKAWSPSAGGMVTCKVTDAVMSGDNYQRAAQLWVSAGTPGAMEVLHIVQDGSGPHLVVNTYSAPGVHSGNVAAFGFAFGFQFPLYFRVVYHSATSIDWLWSASGLLWTPVVMARNPGFTVGRVGIGIDTQQAVTDGEAAYDWVRFA